jgi:hypothetical protein
MNNKEIYLNIYDLHCANKYFCYLGCGFYHTTLVIGDKEFDYGPNTGIDINELNQLNHLNLHQAIYLNNTIKSYDQINDIINILNEKYKAKTYNPLNNNCHDFIEDLYGYVTNDKINITIPIYLSRFKYFCCCFSCLFPRNNHILKYLRIA